MASNPSDPINPRVIAEVGCNHRGDMETAREMIKRAAQFCGVEVVKFQKRTPRELLSAEEYDSPHPNPDNAYGPTYGAHREYLELSAAQHAELKILCEQSGVTYSTSVWDMTSARAMIELQPAMLKVPSACNLNFELLGILADEFAGEIHVSFGMTTQAEEEAVVRFLDRRHRMADTVIYSCTSGYPVSFEDVCLREIDRLRIRFGGTAKAIGFSGHHLGIAVDIAALALGATWFERHFTLDRTWKGTDHAASLEPDGMRKLVRDLRNVSLALAHKSEEVLPVEAVQRAKLKRSVPVHDVDGESKGR